MLSSSEHLTLLESGNHQSPTLGYMCASRKQFAYVDNFPPPKKKIVVDLDDHHHHHQHQQGDRDTPHVSQCNTCFTN